MEHSSSCGLRHSQQSFAVTTDPYLHTVRRRRCRHQVVRRWCRLSRAVNSSFGAWCSIADEELTGVTTHQGAWCPIQLCLRHERRQQVGGGGTLPARRPLTE